jgi:hypothetical protein
MLKLCVGKVDMDGMLGRDNHPDLSDEGTIVTLVASQTLDIETIPLRRLEEAQSSGKYTILTCLRSNGTFVELMDYEIASLARRGD